MLTTLLRPTQRHADARRSRPGSGTRTQVRQRFGIVFQDPEPRQRADRLREHGAARRALPRAARRARAPRAEALLKLFELWERRDDPVKKFSGGMKRRLEIARGFLHTPKILFLDEPTLGLDPQSRNQLWTHVKHLNETEGVTVFLTTHYMDEAERVAQRIADHRSRPDRRAGLVAGAEAADRHRLARRGVPRPDRIVDPRREGRQRRSDAADREDVEAVSDERGLHPVAAGTEALPAVAGADRRLARPADAVPARARLRPRAGLPAGRRGQLPAVRRARRDRHDDPVHLDLLRRRPAVGPAVRVPEGDAGRAGAAHPDHDRPHARRRDGRD